ncbi:MAG: hypothetical protein OXT49_02825 [Gammaproteobacteria bacterium]|nr:hypothetical protein [Gammaproteobacteria bacterium]
MTDLLAPISAGLVCAIAIAVSGRITRFEQELSFYPTILIVIASYYVLFAVMAKQAILEESVGLIIFSTIALIGAFKAPALVGLGIILHGAFDLLHPQLIENAGVPNWWPAFCAAVDFVLGAWVIYLARTTETSPTR